MSGIIGSIGSKSGVISEIEQDFEPWTARTWTYSGFTTPGNAGGATYAGGYARIGRLCFVTGHFSGTSNSTHLYINNLPHTADTVSNNLPGIALGSCTNNGSGNSLGYAYVGNNSTNLYFTKDSDWEGWTSSGTKGAVFGGWYVIK